MGRTYYPKNKELESADWNSAGCSILSILTRKLNLASDNHDPEFPNPPWTLSRKGAISLGKSLDIPDERIGELYDDCQPYLDGTKEEFIQLVSDWREFLLICNGYST